MSTPGATLPPAGPASGAPPGQGVAVLIPCYNEEPTIGAVVAGFRAALPGAMVVVCDNNSTDRTAQAARAAGAQVLLEQRRGKGYAVQTMFRRVEAGIYVMVDGDGTYPAAAVGALIEPIRRGEADMVIGARLRRGASGGFRRANLWGNYLFLAVINLIFGTRLTDLLSGYRAFSRRFVRGVPLFGGGFEVEAELTIKALQRGYRIAEVAVDLGRRPAGSHSKIRLLRDGFIILSTVLALFRDYKPLTFFGGLGLILIGLAALPAAGIALDAGGLRVGLTSHPALATLAAALALGGTLSIAVGLILHSIARHFQELDFQLQVLTGDLHRAGSAPAGDAPPPTEAPE